MGQFVGLTVKSVMAGRHDGGSWSHSASAASSGGRRALLLRSLAPFHPVQNPAHKMVLPIFRVSFPTAVS